MDIDIKEMFREKNRTILLESLKYDLQKNMNSLLETVINIYNLEFETAIKKITSIYEEQDLKVDSKFIDKVISTMKLESYEEIEKLLKEKEKTLEKLILNLEFTEDKLNEYYDSILETTKNVKNDLNKYAIQDVQNKGLKMVDKNATKTEMDEATYNRITDYLTNRLYGKLETKIHMELMLRDNNLINKAKEGYLRYQNITDKTE